MPDIHTLAAEPREQRLKQNRPLRAAGNVPGVIYGKEVGSVAVAFPRREFDRVFHKVGRTQLLDVTVSAENDPRRVLIREVQYDPRVGNVIHVDFFQVNLKEKITADVPLIIVGEAPAVERKEGELQHTMNTLKVSCLPAEIPEHFEVDVSGLEAIDEAVRVGELPVPSGVEILADPEEVVAKIVHIREVEEEEVVEVEGEEGELAEGEVAEGAEGEAEAAEGGEEGGEAPSESSSEES